MRSRLQTVYNMAFLPCSSCPGLLTLNPSWLPSLAPIFPLTGYQALSAPLRYPTLSLPFSTFVHIWSIATECKPVTNGSSSESSGHSEARLMYAVQLLGYRFPWLSSFRSPRLELNLYGSLTSTALQMTTSWSVVHWKYLPLFLLRKSGSHIGSLNTRNVILQKEQKAQFSVM